MGILGETELTSLSISRMILHVVGDSDTPFVEQNEFAAVQHGDFFLARLQDVDVAPVHTLTDQSEMKLLIEGIANGATSFESGAQRISRLFANHHRRNSSDGAFFVFELTDPSSDTFVYALVKYDYSQAIERVDEDGRSALRQIVQAFIADRKAIQKSCLVSVRGGVADMAVSARDRTRQAPDLTDYFAAFLDVTRARSDDELTRTADTTVLKILKESRNLLPNRDVTRAYRSAREALRQRETLANDTVVEIIMLAAGSPTDEQTRAQLERNTRRNLKTSKLDGLEFRPNRRLIAAPKRQKVVTAEGVNLEYPDALENSVVVREELEGGGTRFTIETTRELVVDAPVIEKPRQQA